MKSPDERRFSGGRNAAVRFAPPLSRDLRDFPAAAGYALRWARCERAAFQSVIPQRSMGLSVSGAVAPSAPTDLATESDSSAGDRMSDAARVNVARGPVNLLASAATALLRRWQPGRRAIERDEDLVIVEGVLAQIGHANRVGDD